MLNNDYEACFEILQGLIGVRAAILLVAGLAWCSVLAAAAGGEEPVFNVEYFGARGDGITDDTEVRTRTRRRRSLSDEHSRRL
jgi:hypothetical protein